MARVVFMSLGEVMLVLGKFSVTQGLWKELQKSKYRSKGFQEEKCILLKNKVDDVRRWLAP